MPGAPTIIGDYRVTRVLGRGGMGAVYLADDPLLDRRVAIKVIDGYRDHPSARARFLVEARAIARLNHPNVVAVYRAGEHAGEPYLVSEFVDGTPLDQLPRPLAPAQCQAIALGLAAGLGAAHRQGILHRDVKPGNAILGKDGTVKLLDFGLAKLAEPSGEVAPPAAVAAPSLADQPTEPDGPRPPRALDHDATRTFAPAPATPMSPPLADSGDLTVAGSRLGTPRYMAPEAWRGERLTAASDVFSLGLVLWELFGGRHPLADVPSEGLAAATARVPSLATAAIAAPPAVIAVIDRAVAADPAARFADAGQLAGALTAAFAAPPAAIDERPSRAVAAVMIGAGALALAGVAWVVRPRATPPAVIDAPAVVAIDAGGPAGGAPVPVTALGACASEPVFIDDATLAFTLMRGDDVDVYTLVPGQPPQVAGRTPGAAWDWRAARGQHPGELLFATDGADGRMRIMALARASGIVREVMVGFSVAVVGDTTFVLGDDDPGWIHRRDAGGDARLVEAAGADDLVASPDGAHLAVVVADRETTPRVCVIDVAARRWRCPDGARARNGRPAFSRDGRTLYYAAPDGLRALAVDGDADRLVVPGLPGHGGLAISPDGRALIYSDCHSFGELIAVGAGGQAEVLVPGGLVRHPVGTPGGGVAYVEALPDRGTRLVLRAPGEGLRELARADTELGRPAFSDDGARVAYAQSGAGITVRALAGGAPERWTDVPGDRGPRWLSDGRLAFTRTAGGAPAVWTIAGAGQAPTRLVDGWLLEDRAGARLLVSAGEHRLAWLDPASGKVAPIRLGALAGQTLLAARALPDGALVVLTAERAALVRLDPATGVDAVVYQLPGGQTASDPSVLADGRVAFRAELWLGELYRLDGAW